MHLGRVVAVGPQLDTLEGVARIASRRGGRAAGDHGGRGSDRHRGCRGAHAGGARGARAAAAAAAAARRGLRLGLGCCNLAARETL